MNEQQIYQIIRSKINANVAKDEQIRTWILQLNKEYDMPYTIASDYLTMRSKISDASLVELYKIVSVISPVDVKRCFTESQIGNFHRMMKRVKETNKKDILKFKVLQVADDQYIGKTTIRDIVSLRDLGLILYNENTQRPARIFEYGGIRWQIYVNQKKVNEICDAMLNGIYIPTVITFNLSVDTDWEYDNEKAELVIKTIDTMDIIDGYHRLLAMQKAVAMNPDFNYPFCIQFVLFSEEKAQQFIYQEDQKTHMTKDESRSLKQDDEANQVCAKLNAEPSFLMHGRIGRSNSYISLSMISKYIRDMYFGKSIKYTRKDIIDTFNHIKTKTNTIIDDYPELMNRVWSYEEIYAMIYASRFAKNSFESKVYSLVYENLSEYKNHKKVPKTYKNILHEQLYQYIDI